VTVAAYIGLGSNLEEPARQVHAGVDALRNLPQTQLLDCSSLYRSAPVGAKAQPDFINAVCAAGTQLSALDLMRRLLEIERQHGRVRGAVKGGARTLDLDLLLYGSEIVATRELTLPHPRMHERAFVLAPLVEIAPGLDIPGRGPVTALLRDCAGQRVERLENC
jgi:2-amino-4-hydroxy-6-hydroxymethyldihydropteridine diphosphokinase